MFEHYLAALIGLSQAQDLAYSALPDAPVQPHQEGRKAERDRRRSQPAPPAGAAAAAPAHRPVAAGPDGSSPWDPCPCGWWGITRGDRHGCVALAKELFPQLDQELDRWEAAYGWLYRQRRRPPLGSDT
jgi:hypothetical protein